ncbi:MAG: DNA double-strand break repair nuclease NurA, partial [Candidatus Korarchaeota archaeon]|nr:DNA double-strand break repair nuclease NurA [Candidatus Korarchaeota archaeon]
MGEFLTEFLEALRRRLPDLRGAFLQTDRPSGDLVGRWFRERWLSSLPNEVIPERVVAIDASMDTRQYAGGVAVIYARALALEFHPLDRSRGERVAARTFDVVPYAGPYDEARNLSSRLAEHLEHLAAARAMETLEPGVLLLDGSLAGRHIASAFNFARHGWFAVEYALTYSGMLELARRRGWRVLAVAKSSRAAPMRDLALREIFEDLMSRLSALDPATESDLREAWDLAVRDPVAGVDAALNAA